MPNLAPGTFPSFATNYISLVCADSVDEAIEKYSSSVIVFFRSLPENKIYFRYAAEKWNIKEVLQHLIDVERIFAYRALRIARHDGTPLPGFDHNNYVKVSNADARSWQGLLNEFESVRKSTDLLL